MQALHHSRSRRAAPAPQQVRLLVKELGSTPLAYDDCGSFDETIVVAQLRGELPFVFAQRTLERLAAVARSGGRIGQATLFTGRQHDAHSQEARRLIGTALATQSAAHGGSSELVLEAHDELGGAARHELLALVQDLLAADEAEATPIRLRFSSSPANTEPKSGVFWSTPEPKS